MPTKAPRVSARKPVVIRDRFHIQTKHLVFAAIVVILSGVGQAAGADLWELVKHLAEAL